MSAADELVAWLTQICDEDEAIAKAAISPAHGYLATDSGRWRIYHDGGVEDEGSGDVIVYDEGSPTYAQAEFICANAPAKALARIAADRQILRLHRSLDGGRKCRACLGTVDYRPVGTAQYPCNTLRLMASAYSDRAGYDEGWKP